MKVFLDTNVWLRSIINDESAHHRSAKRFIEEIEQGVYTPYTSTIVLLECSYVLRKIYGQPQEYVCNALEAIRSLRNLTLIERTDFDAAYVLHKKRRHPLSDCLIVTQIPEGVSLATFDERLRRLFSGTLLLLEKVFGNE